MRVHSQEKNGFSLLELMIVVGLSGLLIAIAIPTITGFTRSARLAGAANTLEVDLHYAHALTRAQRKTFEILFEGSSYRLMQVSPLTTLRTRAMPRGVACTASDTAMFYAWGLTDPVTITFADNHSSRVVRLSSNGNVSHD